MAENQTTMKYIFPLLAACVISFSYAQVRFEPGYYLNNANAKVDGLIRDLAWKDNPDFIDFKASENAEPLKITISELAGFEVGNSAYRRFTVEVDLSSSALPDLTNNPNPRFSKKTMLLRQLVSSEISLYEYVSANETRFFIAKGNAVPEQLVFREYLDANNRVAQNNSFRQQLYAALQFRGVPKSDFEKLRYSRGQLVNLFEKAGLKSTAAPVADRSRFRLGVSAGVNAAKFRAVSSNDFDMDDIRMSSTVFAIGIEAEFFFPFNKNKWSVFLNPTYQSFEAENSGAETSSLDYSFIDTPLGVRYYMFLNNRLSVFIDAGPGITLGANGSFDYQYLSTQRSLDLNHSLYAFGGIGVSWGDFAAELRYRGNHNPLSSYQTWNSSFSSVGIQATYKFL